MNDKLLSIYLNDHLAAATGARELVRRARGSTEGELEAFLGRLEAEIGEDRDTLIEVMSRVGAGRDPLKIVAGIAGERLGRLKLNGSLISPSPLSRLTELEVLALGVEGKRGLWMLLGELADRRLSRFDFEALARRAQRQHRQLERWRREAGVAALA